MELEKENTTAAQPAGGDSTKGKDDDKGTMLMEDEEEDKTAMTLELHENEQQVQTYRETSPSSDMKQDNNVNNHDEDDHKVTAILPVLTNDYDFTTPATSNDNDGGGDGGGDDGNGISSSESQYDEDELRELAASLAPSVSKLLNEEALENLLGCYRVDSMASSTGSNANIKDDVGREGSATPQTTFTTATTTTTNRVSSFGTLQDEDDDVYNNNMNMVDETDGLDGELRRLAAAEENLREELEFAGIGEALFGGSPYMKFAAMLGDNEEEEVDFEDKNKKKLIDPPMIVPMRSLVDDDDEEEEEEEELEVDRATDKVEYKGEEDEFVELEKIDTTTTSTTPSGMAPEVNKINDRENMDNPRTPRLASPTSTTKVSSKNESTVSIQTSADPFTTAPPTVADLSTAKKKRSSSSATSYKLLDHAKYLGMKKRPADIGLYTCPLISRSDVEFILTVPPLVEDVYETCRKVAEDEPFHPDSFSAQKMKQRGSGRRRRRRRLSRPSPPALDDGNNYNREGTAGRDMLSPSSLSPRVDADFSNLYDDDDYQDSDEEENSNVEWDGENSSDKEEREIDENQGSYDDEDAYLKQTSSLSPRVDEEFSKMNRGRSDSLSSPPTSIDGGRSDTTPDVINRVTRRGDNLVVDEAKETADKAAAAAARADIINQMVDCTWEYIHPLSTSALRRLYVGLNPLATRSTRTAEEVCPLASQSLRRKHSRKPRSVGRENIVSDSEMAVGGGGGSTREVVGSTTSIMDAEEDEIDEPLPIRTVGIRIRPDVLCGAVMDAVHGAVQNLGGEMTKRQGGHLRALLPACWLVDGGSGSDDGSRLDNSISSGFTSLLSLGGSSRSLEGTTRRQTKLLPPFMIDAQLCTRKRSRDYERTLLIRTFAVDFDGEGEKGGGSTTRDGVMLPPISSCDFVEDDAQRMDANGTLIREAAALVQRMECEGEASNMDHLRKFLHPKSLSTPPSSVTASHGSSYAKQIGEILTSPLRMFTHGSGSAKKLDIQTPHHSSSANTNSHLLSEAVSAHLLHNYQASPSVQNDEKRRHRFSFILPALSEEDWPYVQSSWRFLKECINELDNRDLAYSTLGMGSFGSFPALPTLDVHYCSQIRLLCRENMIVSLLKSASELEQYARESEYSCASLIQLLRPTFESYKLTPPALPRPVPLTAYPLDFQPPEATCPPWGLKVMEALNNVAALSGTDNSTIITNYKGMSSNQGPNEERGENGLAAEKSNDINAPLKAAQTKTRTPGFQRSQEAVMIVVSAFQQQDDEELSARLGRKNVQVMDRLAKMQAHKRESIIRIRDSYGSNLLATKAADDFHSKAQHVKPKKTPSHLKPNNRCSQPGKSFKENIHASSPICTASDRVPLLSCSILVGGSTGTCYVAANEILFVTQFIPILGGCRASLFNVTDVDIVVLPPSSSLLNPLPAGISVRSSRCEGKELFSCIPSIGAARFKSFVDIVNTVATEDPETLKFSARGGLLYMFDESNALKARAVSGPTEEGPSDREAPCPILHSSRLDDD